MQFTVNKYQYRFKWIDKKIIIKKFEKENWIQFIVGEMGSKWIELLQIKFRIE